MNYNYECVFRSHGHVGRAGLGGGTRVGKRQYFDLHDKPEQSLDMVILGLLGREGDIIVELIG